MFLQGVFDDGNRALFLTFQTSVFCRVREKNGGKTHFSAELRPSFDKFSGICYEPIILNVINKELRVRTKDTHASTAPAVAPATLSDT